MQVDSSESKQALADIKSDKPPVEPIFPAELRKRQPSPLHLPGPLADWHRCVLLYSTCIHNQLVHPDSSRQAHSLPLHTFKAVAGHMHHACKIQLITAILTPRLGKLLWSGTDMLKTDWLWRQSTASIHIQLKPNASSHGIDDMA